MSKVSIALCTYNGERFLQEQLDSIAAQIRLPDEVVVGDDGSTDSTLAILERWKAEMPFQVKILRNPENLGYSRNFENVVKHTSGDILFFCDQDDVWWPHKIKKVLEIFEQNPDTGVVFHNHQVIDADGNDLGLDELKIRWISNITLSLRFFCPVDKEHPIVSGCCCAVRTKLLHQMIPFFTAHDLTVYALGRALSHVVTLPEALMNFRYHSKNISLFHTVHEQKKYNQQFLHDSYKLDVPRFWGYYQDIQYFQQRVQAAPDSPTRRKMRRFLRFTISHLTNRSRVQRNAVLFFPIWIFEALCFRYFRRPQPFRAMFYDLLHGLGMTGKEK